MTLTLPWPFGRRRPSAPRVDDAKDAAAGGGAKDGGAPDAAGAVDAGGAAGAEAMTQARFGGGDEPTEWVTVYNAASFEEAHIVKGALEAMDVPAVLRYEAVGRLYGTLTLGGVEVQVPRPLETQALAVLDEVPEVEDPPAEADPP